MSFSPPPDLTASQTAIWLDQQLFAGRPIYNTGQVLKIHGQLRVDLFQRALLDTVAESPGLRLTPLAIPTDLTLLDFRSCGDPAVMADDWMRAEMRVPIDTDDCNLFRFALIRTSDNETLWFQKFHHIIIDATGRRLLSARTAARYRALRFGEPIEPAITTTNRDVAEGEHRYAASDDSKADRDYWVETFADSPASLIGEHRQSTERAKSGVHSRQIFKLKRSAFERLRTLARTLNSTESRAVIALVYAAFARLYNRSDIVMGVELANRSDERARNFIGLLARPLPMKLDVDARTSIADVVREIDNTRARNYPHRRYPIQELARDLEITRRGQHGLFDVIVNFIPAPYDFAFEEMPVELTTLSNGFATPWLVTITDSNLAGDLDVSIDTDPGLIDPVTAAVLVNILETLLQRGLDDPACSLATLPIMSAEACSELISLGKGVAVALPENETLASLCSAQAKQTPDAIALRYEAETLSFASLHERALKLAQHLATLGVKPGVTVGIALPRTPSLVVAVLAVHKAGGAYLALDPSYPADRITFMVKDSAVPIILTTSDLRPLLDSGEETQIVDIGVADFESKHIALKSPGPDDIAYVLYTSGSTGRPKAVGITHRNLANLIHWGRSVLSDDEIGGLLFSTSLNFDLSAFEMFLPLAFGGCIVLVENLLALQAAPQRESVRLINSGPSLLDRLLRANALPCSVTTIILAGEKLPRRLADALFAVAPEMRLINCYGPTETTVYSSWAVVDQADGNEPSIGRPIWNTSFFVLDSSQELTPAGLEGELYIGGTGVARGYIGRSDLTSERFLANSFVEGPIYRTGDRVRWQRNGELEYLGRTDDQMKINGIRVEPGEIESVLAAQPGIVAAVATFREGDNGTRRLIAYVVGHSDGTPSNDQLRAAAERQLPRNMVPSTFVRIDSLPLTPNGKLDRKALPAPPTEAVQAVDDIQPQTELEREIAQIWKDLFGKSAISTQADFFDVGGDSLALLSLFASIESRYGRRLTVDILADGLSIRSLARFLSGDISIENTGPLVTLQPHGQLSPLYLVHGIAGEVVHLQRLATHMGKSRPVIGIRLLPDAPPPSSLAELAKPYVTAVRKHQPVGPYYLGGHSFGATVAYEMAVQLLAQGCEVGLLAIIDQRKPGWRLTFREALPALPRILSSIPRRIRDEWTETPSPHRIDKLKRVFVRWIGSAIGYRAPAVAVFNIDRNETKLISMFEANFRSLRAYRPPKLKAPIVLYRAKRQSVSHSALDRTLGWFELARGGVEVRELHGNHGSILREPEVVELARMLTADLNTQQTANVPVELSQALSQPSL